MSFITRKQLAQILGVSEKTVQRRENLLNIKPEISDRGSKIYSDRDLALFKEQHQYLQDKSKTLKTFLPNTPVEIVPDKVASSKEQGASIDTSSLLATCYLSEAKLATFLADLELLQQLCDRAWLLDTNRLAMILGISPKTLVKYQTYEYGGFCCSREAKKNNRIWWKVSFAQKKIENRSDRANPSQASPGNN